MPLSCISCLVSRTTLVGGFQTKTLTKTVTFHYSIGHMKRPELLAVVLHMCSSCNVESCEASARCDDTRIALNFSQTLDYRSRSSVVWSTIYAI